VAEFLMAVRIFGHGGFPTNNSSHILVCLSTRPVHFSEFRCACYMPEMVAAWEHLLEFRVRDVVEVF
jgi:hypothetical protein